MLGFAVALPVAAGAATYEFGLQGRPVICVPEIDVPDYNRQLTQSSLSLVPTTTPRELLTFQYNYNDIVRAIPQFHRNQDYRDDDPPNTIFGGVSLISRNYPLTAPNSGAGRDVEYIWDRSGPCKNPVILKVPQSSEFLARCGAAEQVEHILHILFNRYPGAGKRPKDIYAAVEARCTHTSIGFGPHQGTVQEDCLRQIIVGNFLIDYNFQIENAGLIPQMDTFFRKKVVSWNRNCGHG